MFPQSIRWRLPLSYAAIALLTTLALGTVLLVSLREYYAQRESDYLESNARGIVNITQPLLEANLPSEAIEEQLKSLAFLSQTRVRLFNEAGHVLADSGSPVERDNSLALGLHRLQPPDLGLPPLAPALGTDVEEVVEMQFEVDLLEDGSQQVITKTIQHIEYKALFIVEDGPESTMITKTNYFVISDPNLQVQKENGPGGQPENIGVDFMFRIPTKRTFFGFGLDPEITGDGRMSDQVVSLSFVDSEGNVLGSIELSEGPAYGQQILERVALGWTIASVVAVFLAAGVGWLISRRISQPLLSLTAVTDKMAHGNLSVRANVARQDELGTLATVFNEMAQQVEDTVVTLRRFVADAAHEINTPLTALQTNLELIANEEDGADRRTFVAQAQIQMERLAALTTGLLELSRIEANMVKEKYVPLDLIALVQETSELYASRAEQAGLSFSLEIRPEPVTIWGDKTQLRLAIGNLLDNALKFTPTGGLVRVVVHQKGQWAELQIEDTGIGIPAEDLPQLFHRFHRGHNAAGYPGSGLGLAIVKAVVDGHGGQVITENTAQGACFSLQLPIV